MPHKVLIAIVALLYAAPLFAQFDFPSMGGRSAAMGGVSVSLDDEMSAMHVAAVLSRKDKVSLAIGARQDFLAQGMGYAMLGGIVPVGFGATSVSVVHYGNKDYNEQQFTAAYGMPLGEVVSLGASLHYLHSGTSDPYYAPIHRLTFSLSLSACPSDDIRIGFRAFNPVAALSDGRGVDGLPVVFDIGVLYKLLEDLIVVAEVEKSLYYQASVRVGLEYALQQMYFFRIGVNSFPTVYTFGFGMKPGSFGIDMAAQIHSVLGMTPQLSLYYCF